MTDSERVRLHIDYLPEGEEISDGCARTIASWWAAGMGVGQAFATSGAITDPTDDVWRDLTDGGRCYTSASPEDKRALDCLGTYLLNAGPRGPQPGWSGVWV